MQGINTTLCYIEQNGCYLMLHRVKKKNDINHDKWVGIGGKFEEKESPEDCVLREVKEETGLTLTHLEYRGLVTFTSDRYQTEYMHLFWADRFTGELCECDEGTLEWISKESLHKIPKWQGDEIFLQLLEERVPFFSLKLCYKGDTLIEAVLNGTSLSLGVHLQNGQKKDTQQGAEHTAQ